MTTELWVTVILSIVGSGAVVTMINFFLTRKRFAVETKKLTIEAESLKADMVLKITDYWKNHSKDLQVEIERISAKLDNEIDKFNTCREELTKLKEEVEQLKKLNRK